MKITIEHDSYGKSRVRLTKVRRRGEVHEVVEFSVDVALQGDFAAAYSAGDNRHVIPTDTMKNTAYVLARRHELRNTESFACELARHFVESFSHVNRAMVNVVEHPWQRATVKGSRHAHVFLGSTTERCTCSVSAVRAGKGLIDCTVFSGISGLSIMKTTQSGFSGFLRDNYTTLADTDNRILATTIEAQWSYCAPPDNYRSLRGRIRATLVEAFAARFSPSVQATMHDMAIAVLESESAVASVRLTMPNQHRIMVNLAPFGLDNPNDIFVTTDEPYGNIIAEFSRDSSGATLEP